MSCRFVVSCSVFDDVVNTLMLYNVYFTFNKFDNLGFVELYVFNINPDLYKKLYDFIGFHNRKEL